MPPFKEERAYCFAHFVLSVCPSVTFSFPINNSKTPRPTFLKLGPHIRPGQQRNPIDFGVKGQGHQGQMCQNRFRSITGECLDLPSSNMFHTSILGSRGTFLIFGSLGQRSRSPSQICQSVKVTISQNEFLLHTFVQLI